MNDFSYTQAAVKAISSYKNQYGPIASFALRIQEDNPSWALLNCIAVAHDRTTLAATDHKFNDGPAPVAPPIAFLDFCQLVMNKVCGLARQDMRGKRTEDFGNGIDFTQELTDQIGFSVDASRVAELVDDDFFQLNNLHCYIGQGMEYLTDIENLRYHAESVKLEDGTWIKDHIADSFDEALSVLDSKAQEYATQQAELRQGESSTIDFAAKLKDTADAKRTKKRLAKSAKEFEADLSKRKATKKQLNELVAQSA